jgi:RNA polymerase sigma-70 factor (ECF subfamily)
MMRVTRIAARESGEILRVEGRLTHETAEELHMACEATLAERRSLRLDLSGLQFVDPTGVAVLHGLERRGTRLEGASGFVRALLARTDDVTPEPTPIPSPAGDGALVERLRERDADAFEVLVREHGGRMLATARRFVGSEDDASDVVQEAFISAFRAIDGFAGAARLSTWLHRIVVNTALMRLRSRRRRREEPIEGLLPRFDEEGRWADPPARWSASTDALLERQQTRAAVRSAIDRLPLNYRTVILLRDIEELDTDETASVLGMTVNAVKIRLHRARQALRTLLEREFHGDAPQEDEPSGAPARRPA